MPGKSGNNGCDIPPKARDTARTLNTKLWVFLHHHGLDLWSTDLALATLERSENLIISDDMTNSSHMPNLGSSSHPYGLEEAPVVHGPDPGVC